MRKPQVVVAQIGAREHYEVGAGLARADQLSALITDFWNPIRRPLPRRLAASLPTPLAALWERRRSEIPTRLVHALATRGAGWRLAASRAAGKAERYLTFARIGSAFAKAILPHLSRIEHTCFFGYSGASLEAIRHERDSRRRTVLDQVDPARTGDRIVLEEEKRYPQLSLGSESVPEEFYRRLDEEWSDSDVILVNSAWSRDALVEQGALSQKIQIVPLSYARNCPLARQPRASSLRVLWLGTLGLGKGLHYAIDSARLLVNAPVQFTFCGPLAVRRSGLDLPANSLYLPRVARGAASSLYAAHDIFLLPTLSDGFAITQIEAMSFGLPVIATRCCGDVVQDGISGHFVPCRDARAIASTIETFLAKDVLERMSAAALTRSEDFLPERIWPLYQRVFEGPESFPSEARAT